MLAQDGWDELRVSGFLCHCSGPRRRRHTITAVFVTTNLVYSNFIRGVLRLAICCLSDARFSGSGVARVMACAVSLVSGCVNIRVQARFTYRVDSPPAWML